MKNRFANYLKGYEKGQALVLALIMLGVGSLVLAPLLSFMSSGLSAGVTIEDKTDELYDADAGIQDAIWKINHRDEVPGVPKIKDDPDMVYSIPLLNSEHNEEIDEINIIIDCIDDEIGGVYRVRSWVGDTVVDNETMIDAIISTVWFDYTGITQHIITSQGSYDIDVGVDVEPPDPYPDHPNGAHGNYDGPWPTPEALIDWYERDVDKDNPYPFDEIDLDGVDASLGPEYIDGEFTMRNFSNTKATLTLTGTIYITGNTVIGGNKEWFLDLNGQTIFVESDSVGGGASGTALIINSNCTLVGSGCIIAVGDIDFSPSLETEPDEYVLVLSIIGETLMHPSGDFYGTLAGSVHVDVKSGETPHIQWNPPPDDLNFPGSGGGAGMVWSIHTWSYWTIGDEFP